MFKAALNWACQKYERGQPLLTRHALEKHKIPTERDPKRPVLDDTTIRALLAVAPSVHPFLRPLILLAWRTGRRLSSILALRWDDVDSLRRVVEFERPDGGSGASQGASAEHAHLHAHPRKETKRDAAYDRIALRVAPPGIEPGLS